MAGGGGHEPNLTPLIDLFSVLIVFLLMTAAWTQLESFQVQINESPKLNPDMESMTPPPEDKNEKKKKLTLEIHKDQIIAKDGEEDKTFPLQGLNVESPALINLLNQWKTESPPEQQLILSSEGEAFYGQLIKVYDLVQIQGWTNIAISPY